MQKVPSHKKKLRLQAKETIKNLVSDKQLFYQRQQKLVERIESLPEFQKAKNILTYYPLDDEFDLTSLIISNENKNWFLPRPIGKSIMLMFQVENMHELIDVRFGVKAPKSSNQTILPSEIDLFIVPALSFDKQGYRLGRGAGYYDRLLSIASKKSKSIGVIFEELLLDELPHEAHDVKLDKVLTM